MKAMLIYFVIVIFLGIHLRAETTIEIAPGPTIEPAQVST